MASPIQFEDSLDCKIPVRYDLMTEKQAEKFYERLSRLAEPKLSRQMRRKEVRFRVKAKEYKNKIIYDDFQRIYFEQYFQRIGVLSLTEDNCSDDMWIKYADNHEGFCIGYNSRILFEYLGGGAEVEYFDEIPILLPDPIMNSDEIRYKQIFFKERKWEYESEYRTQKFWPNGATNEDRNIVIPKEAFHSVILGKRMSTEDKAEIIREITDNIGLIDVIDHENIC